MVENPKEGILCPGARSKTSVFLLQLAPAGQWGGPQANDPIPEEEGISVRLVSLTARPPAQEGGALESLHGRAGRPYAGSVRDPLDVTSRRSMATAVPISTFKVRYSGEDLTFPEYVHRALQLAAEQAIAPARKVGQPPNRDPVF